MPFDLEQSYREQMEDWMHFAKDLQRAFRGDNWDAPIQGLTPHEAKIARLLAKHPAVRFDQFTEAMRRDPCDQGPTLGSLKSLMSRVRRNLEEHRVNCEIQCKYNSWHATNRKALQRHLAKYERPMAHVPEGTCVSRVAA